MPEQNALRVLAYHAIRDLAGEPILEPYGMPPALFARQLDALQQAGYHFVSGEEVLRFLQGQAGLPHKAVLLTFDDGYEELLADVLPMLTARAIPAIVFAVTQQLGGTNEWDKRIGAASLRLLDICGLQRLREQGIEIGAHSRTHKMLSRLVIEEIREEIAGSVEDLEAVGLGRPRFFSYPHGEFNTCVQQVVQEAGLQAMQLPVYQNLLSHVLAKNHLRLADGTPGPMATSAAEQSTPAILPHADGSQPLPAAA